MTVRPVSSRSVSAPMSIGLVVCVSPADSAPRYFGGPSTYSLVESGKPRLELLTTDA
jgi:hypothetical protein